MKPNGTSLVVTRLLDLRGHLSIVHHLPGRIRLRLGPALWGGVAGVDRDMLRQVLDRLDGIDDIRINAAVASVVIQYNPHRVPPEDWETLVQGEAPAAEALLKRWVEHLSGQLSNLVEERSAS